MESRKISKSHLVRLSDVEEHKIEAMMYEPNDIPFIAVNISNLVILFQITHQNKKLSISEENLLDQLRHEILVTT